LPALASAHPGIGIVRSSTGVIYYTDLTHVWKLTPGGKPTIAVRDVHTHELWIDAKDNLYGEHLRYEGDATQQWNHRVWRLAADGTLTDIIPTRRGFRDDYDDFHFVRDAAGAMYWADADTPISVRKRTPDGRVATIVTGGFRNIRSMVVAPSGEIYIVDLHDLVRLHPDGRRDLVVRNLADNRRSTLGTVETHAIMGVWLDQAGDVYAAVFGDRVVKKVTRDGKVMVVARADGNWVATGGLVAPNGELWLLEYNGNAARARRIVTAKSGN
jgi:hypothetical protein